MAADEAALGGSAGKRSECAVERGWWGTFAGNGNWLPEAENAMILERIEVESRSEYRASQEPRGFLWRGRHYVIARVLDRWYEGYADARRSPLRYFRVESGEGEEFIIRCHDQLGAWSIELPDANSPGIF